MRWKEARKGGGWPLAALAVLILLTVTLFGATVAGAAGKGSNKSTTAEAQPPEKVVFPARVGEVVFPHAMHVNDLGIDCTDCHHPVKAPELKTPHPQYFKECQVACSTCHHADGTTRQTHNCTTCHGEPGPQSSRIPSAKVALHEMCGNCHDIGTGKDASASCSFCHTGPRKPW
ncbi:MAG TPA: hypothetical protein ENK19_12450 [Acidobacteria bacterium]|nr:hypothetical protein [Acidobacteriota bacterium]